MGEVIELVAQCAGVAERMNRLMGLRDRAQTTVNHLTETRRPLETDRPEKQVEWIQRVKHVVEPVATTDPEIRGFLSPLLVIPETLPSDPGPLRNLCAEVEGAHGNVIKTLTHEIAGWNQEISGLYRPFQPTEDEVRRFMGDLREVLCRIPVEPRQLREVRSEIERLVMWDMVGKRSPMRMKGTMADLESLRGRLDELMEYLPSTAGNVSAPQPTDVATRTVSSDGSGVGFEPSRRHGPKPAMEQHRQTARIVGSFGREWRQQDALEKIAEELDRAQIPLPHAWKRWKRVPRTWSRAVEYHSDRVRKTLVYSLEMAARPNPGPTPGTPAAGT